MLRLRTGFSGIGDPGALRALAERGHEAVRPCAPESVLALARLSGVPYTSENIGILRAIATRNKPCGRACVVVGLPAIAHLALRPFARLTGRPLESFASVAEAKDWLAEQG